MKFVKGQTPWNLGKKVGYIPHLKMRGKTPWNKGLANPELSERNRLPKNRERMRQKMLLNNPMKNPDVVEKVSGSNSHHWKGSAIKYDSLHGWIERQAGKAKICSFDSTHSSTRYHWANISGSYPRDLSDYVSLCAACHGSYDAIRRGYMTPRGRRLK